MAIPKLIRFGLVLNDIAADASLPIDLGDWTLDRASSAEVQQFRQELTRASGMGQVSDIPPPQETTLIFETGENGKVSVSQDIERDPGKWRYCVIRPNLPTRPGAEPGITEALRLCEDDLWVEIW